MDFGCEVEVSRKVRFEELATTEPAAGGSNSTLTDVRVSEMFVTEERFRRRAWYTPA
ncbi:hypothetical protein [Haladaptatus halobius]|uniref:hypothetical protein n=1 Tax=Haladaptatus halobius TaxID=2884875 RepID=UPI001D0B61B4|nr:hypothetical protein [Haladaptatus halobius]